ncbi:50S ribosomal protein L9 [bacterium]|nr:50S ribosomal protein L9 [bacterium]
MRKRTIVAIIILTLLLLGYIGVYFFLLDDSMRQNILYSVPILVLVIPIMFMLGGLIVARTRLNENIKLQRALEVEKEISDSLAKNNEVVSKRLPVGFIVYDDSKNITYANECAKIIFQTDLLGKNITYLSKELNSAISDEKGEIELTIYERIYKTTIALEMRSVYLFDITEEKFAKENYDISRPSMVIISLDNVDETMSGLDLKVKTDLLGKYYVAIEKWRDRFGLYVLSDSSNKQVFVVKKNDLEEIIKDDFSILRDIEQVSKQEGVDISLSIGIGTGSEDYKALGFYAEKALEYVYSRGGNQAVIYNGETKVAYGAKTASQERVSKISTRIFANKLMAVIKDSSSIVILPHDNTDADALGSAMGLCELCEKIGTPAKVLINPQSIDSTVKKIINVSTTEYIKFRQDIITEAELEDFFKGKKMLIVVDHNQMKHSPSKEVYKRADRIYLIDHHRLSESIDFSPIDPFLDPSASSAVELVTEIAELLPLQIDFSSFVATVMLVGMMIDTNGFALHVTDRTFQAASVLMHNNADSFKAKMYLREDINEQKERMKLLQNVEIVYDKVAIVVDTSDQKTSRENLAKNAEALLNVDNIVASFAIGKLDTNVTGISGRSDGSFNIHTEMEKFGGGGHFNMGAAQVQNKTVDLVHQELLMNLDKTIKGDTTIMRVILIEDVKNQGKKGDIIKCTPGYANYLLTKRLAIEANSSNMAVLDEEKAAVEKQQKEELDVARKLKEIVDQTIVIIPVKTSDNGRLFGSVTTKQIAEELQKQHDITIDKRRISLPDEKIDSLGTYTCVVKLHKEVVAELTIDVKEEREV